MSDDGIGSKQNLLPVFIPCVPITLSQCISNHLGCHRPEPSSNGNAERAAREPEPSPSTNAHTTPVCQSHFPIFGLENVPRMTFIRGLFDLPVLAWAERKQDLREFICKHVQDYISHLQTNMSPSTPLGLTDWKVNTLRASNHNLLKCNCPPCRAGCKFTSYQRGKLK